jgi:stage IV sporulation protein FB
MNPKVPSVGQRRCLDDALRLLQEKTAPAVVVVDTDGRLIGLVTSETIGEMLMLQQAMPKGTTWGPWSRPTSAG